MAGPFSFAWCGPGQSFDASMLREDEIVFSFDITHQEAQIPTLDIDIKNPRIGLLAPGRAQWAWFSYQGTPLFYGRLVALPSNLLAEVVTLKFLARPINYLAQKKAVAQGLKVSPFYEPIWISHDKLDDPDTIIEPYTVAWHVDRVTQQVTVSDIIFGEDGTEEFQEADSFYDSVTINFAQAPATQVQFNGSVNWTQTATGTVPAVSKLVINVYNGDAWTGSWPKKGAGLQGGWSVEDASCVDTYNAASYHASNVSISWQNQEETHQNGDTMSIDIQESAPIGPGLTRVTSAYSGFQVGDPLHGTPASSWAGNTWVSMAASSIVATLALRWNMERGRTENIKFTMNSQVQPIVTVPLDEPTAPIQLSLNGADVGSAALGVPIGDPGRGAFLPTERGIAAIQYPLLIARAHLLQAARAVKVQFDCTIERSLHLSCRKNALIHDHRLPGGQAFGKITEYHIKGDGDKGLLIGQVQIECTIGTGASISISEGAPTYVDVGYVEPNYQVYDGVVIALPTNDVAFSIPGFGVDPGAISSLVKYVHLHTGAEPGFYAYTEQVLTDQSGSGEASVQQRVTDTQDANAKAEAELQQIAKFGPWLEIVLAPVTGQDFTVEYDLSVGDLVMPMTLNLAAGSSL